MNVHECLHATYYTRNVSWLKGKRENTWKKYVSTVSKQLLSIVWGVEEVIRLLQLFQNFQWLFFLLKNLVFVQKKLVCRKGLVWFFFVYVNVDIFGLLKNKQIQLLFAIWFFPWKIKPHLKTWHSKWLNQKRCSVTSLLNHAFCRCFTCEYFWDFLLLWFSKGICKILEIFTGGEHYFSVSLSLPFIFLAPSLCAKIFHYMLVLLCLKTYTSLISKKTPRGISLVSTLLLASRFKLSICFLLSVVCHCDFLWLISFSIKWWLDIATGSCGWGFRSDTDSAHFIWNAKGQYKQRSQILVTAGAHVELQGLKSDCS